MTDRKIIIGLFVKTLEKNIEASQGNISMQKDYLADQPGPMQSRYDSGLVEGQWQLSGMQKNLDDMKRALALLNEIADVESKTVCNGSIVILNQNGKNNGYLLLDSKGGAGASVFHDGMKYTIITPQSPLGKVILGRKSGERAEFKTSKVMSCIIKEVY